MAPYLLDNINYDVDLSIVVPAYNEESRLPIMMKDTVEVRKIEFINNDTY